MRLRIFLPDGSVCIDKDILELPILIGRREGILVNENSVSSKHLELSKKDDKIMVRDLGSTNGTKWNGKELKEAVLTVPFTLELGKGVRLELSVLESTIVIPKVNKQSVARSTARPVNGNPELNTSLYIFHAWRMLSELSIWKFLTFFTVLALITIPVRVLCTGESLALASTVTATLFALKYLLAAAAGALVLASIGKFFRQKYEPKPAWIVFASTSALLYPLKMYLLPFSMHASFGIFVAILCPVIFATVTLAWAYTFCLTVSSHRHPRSLLIATVVITVLVCLAEINENAIISRETFAKEAFHRGARIVQLVAGTPISPKQVGEEIRAVASTSPPEKTP